MNPRLRHWLDTLRRLADAGRETVSQSRLADELSRRVGTVAGEIVRAAVAGAAEAVTVDRPAPAACECPTWRQLGDALAAAALAAGQVPNGRVVAAALGALSAAADLIARAHSDRDPNT